MGLFYDFLYQNNFADNSSEISELSETEELSAKLFWYKKS